MRLGTKQSEEPWYKTERCLKLGHIAPFSTLVYEEKTNAAETLIEEVLKLFSLRGVSKFSRTALPWG